MTMPVKVAKAWRKLSTYLPTDGLESLRLALIKDDPKLIQGCWVTEEGACAIGLPIIASSSPASGKRKLLALWVWFQMRHFLSIRHFVHWFDSGWFNRKQTFAALLPEVNRELARRNKNQVLVPLPECTREGSQQRELVFSEIVK